MHVAMGDLCCGPPQPRLFAIIMCDLLHFQCKHVAQGHAIAAINGLDNTAEFKLSARIHFTSMSTAYQSLKVCMQAKQCFCCSKDFELALQSRQSVQHIQSVNCTAENHMLAQRTGHLGMQPISSIAGLQFKPRLKHCVLTRKLVSRGDHLLSCLAVYP